jgi:hypothetical protein
MTDIMDMLNQLPEFFTQLKSKLTLQEERIKHTIHWEQIDQAKRFSPATGICGLCTKEIFHITFNQQKK